MALAATSAGCVSSEHAATSAGCVSSEHVQRARPASTEDPTEVFRADRNLPSSVKIIGDLGSNNANGLGRNDALVLFDAANNIVD